MSQLNEYNDYPKWIDSLTEEQRYEWYLRAKEFVLRFKSTSDTSRLENAITNYEIRNGISQ